MASVSRSCRNASTSARSCACLGSGQRGGDDDDALNWKPTNLAYNPDTRLDPAQAKTIAIGRLGDTRKNPQEIGKSIEDGGNKPVTTKDDVAAWSSDKLKSTLAELGFKLVDNNPQLLIGGEVQNFYVLENTSYKSNVRIKLSASDPSGKVLWQGFAVGNASRFGRSYKLENYYEALSDAYLDAVQNLLKDKEFIAAVK
ncbi:DUF4136 domain-containing protein [Crenobacter cavernae]|uniref:DUF4136 domain-containing protein n=1 Tax=Crenobacter cavernae TaxID=2290923 RepID=UPI0014196BFE|nr:DUF4136 domain-containing protein [Crenobacter cavernae]